MREQIQADYERWIAEQERMPEPCRVCDHRASDHDEIGGCLNGWDTLIAPNPWGCRCTLTRSAVLMSDGSRA